MAMVKCQVHKYIKKMQELVENWRKKKMKVWKKMAHSCCLSLIYIVEVAFWAAILEVGSTWKIAGELDFSVIPNFSLF